MNMRFLSMSRDRDNVDNNDSIKVFDSLGAKTQLKQIAHPECILFYIHIGYSVVYT